jgi:hypothetical protein
MLMNTIEQLKVDEGFRSRPSYCDHKDSPLAFSAKIIH